MIGNFFNGLDEMGGTSILSVGGLRLLLVGFGGFGTSKTVGMAFQTRFFFVSFMNWCCSKWMEHILKHTS
jgi:hypothetical protein